MTCIDTSKSNTYSQIVGIFNNCFQVVILVSFRRAIWHHEIMNLIST